MKDSHLVFTNDDGLTNDGSPGHSASPTNGRSRRWARVSDRLRHALRLTKNPTNASPDQAPQPDRPPTTAFVLAGGGSRGATQVGMLRELVERGIQADLVFGASVGAINGAAYAGEPNLLGVDRLEKVWSGLTGEDVFPRTRGHGPWRYFQQRPSVHSGAGLRKIIEAGITFDRLEEAPVPVQVVATSLRTGSERWLDSGPAVEAVLASAAIPALLPPVEIGDDLLIDGGVVNNVPISRAIEAGATRIYVLLCGPVDLVPMPVFRPAEALLSAFFVSIHSRFVRDLQTVPPGVELIVFQGNAEPTLDYRDFSRSVELMAEGRHEVTRVLAERALRALGPPGPVPTAAAGSFEPALPASEHFDGYDSFGQKEPVRDRSSLGAPDPPGPEGRSAAPAAAAASDVTTSW